MRPVRSLLRAAVLAGALLGALLAPGTAAAQSPPPGGEWLTFETEHFRLIYPPALEPLARRAAAVAERTHAVLRAELGEPPPGPIDLVVTDHTDYTNGFANIFPSNRIVVYVRPPVTTPQLAYSRDWIELVVVHEVVHVFHLGESGRVGNAVRAVLGRVPFLWPVFPVAGSPAWNVEGLATWYESRLTGAGRVGGSFHDMIARTAVLEARLPELDELSAPHPAWPGGQKSYGYGSRLMDWVAERHGPDVHARLVEATGGSIRPTFLAFDHVADGVVGQPFDALWAEWRQAYTREARALADSLRALGLTATRPLAGEGPFAARPRQSPDGGRLAFTAHDFRSDPATRVLDLATGRLRTLVRKNQFGGILGPAAWLPDGRSLVVAQLELAGRYRAYSDLWRIGLDGTEERLTRNQRLSAPDVAPDGRRVAAIRNRDGALQLVVHDLESGETRVLADAAPGLGFDAPRWSPDGRHIAASRFARGRVDVVVVDAATGRVTPVAEDDALDLSPAWTPDGRWLLWSSDRTGIPDIMAVAMTPVGEPRGPVRQVTRLLTGAYDPEVSRDGRTLYLSVYHHDGWRIEATPLDPGGWGPAPPSRMAMGPGLLPAPAPALEDGSHAGTSSGGDPGPVGAPGGAAAGGDTAGGDASPYSPWPTLRPYYWLPEFASFSDPGGSLTFLGLAIDGRDVLSRHAWRLQAALDPGTGRLRGGGSWTYRGLERVDIAVGLSRDWQRATTLDLAGGGIESVWARTDRGALDVVGWRARWRSVSWLRVGGEAERRSLEGHTLSDAELEAEGWTLGPDLRTVGLSAGTGYANARRHPFSISPQDGISLALDAGRWWDVDEGAVAWDEAVGSVAGYLGLPLGGFSDHVLALRLAGLVRDGDRAATHSIGGVPGGTSVVPGTEGIAGLDGGAYFPLRGYTRGIRQGTRAWSATGEWRFPLHLRDPYGGILGVSLTSVSGALFVDAGDAWCPGIAHGGTACSPEPRNALVTAGGELVVDFGAFHNQRVVARLGAGVGVAGRPGEWAVYLSLGPAF